MGGDMRGQENALAPRALNKPFDSELAASDLDLPAVQRFENEAVEVAEAVIDGAPSPCR